MGLMVGLPEEDRNYGRDGSELSAEPSVMLLWHHGSSTVASYIGRERDRQTDRDRETVTTITTLVPRNRPRQRESEQKTFDVLYVRVLTGPKANHCSRA